MKLIKLDKMLQLAKECKMKRGQFDTELTLKAIRKRYWVAEIPIPYIEKRKAKNLMIKKITQNIFDLFRLYVVMKNEPYKGTLRYRRFCREDL